MNRKREAIEQYIILNQDSLYRLAYSYVRNREQALDIVQDSIVKALDKAGTLKDIASVKSWYYGILVNTALDYMRKNKRTVLTDTIESLSDGSQEDISENISITDSLYALSEQQRTIIIMRFFEDMKLSDISKILGVNLSTVKTRLYKALDILKIELKEVD